MVALDYFRRLGHDNHRRLCKVYGWEEKKSKTSWGAETVDYEKIAGAVVQAMTAADLHRFLVVCALLSDLYCPGYIDFERLFVFTLCSAFFVVRTKENVRLANQFFD